MEGVWGETGDVLELERLEMIRFQVSRDLVRAGAGARARARATAGTRVVMDVAGCTFQCTIVP